MKAKYSQEIFSAESITKSQIQDALVTGFIDKEHASDSVYQPLLVVNNYRAGNKFLTRLVRELTHCEAFRISVAFVTEGGLNCLIQTLDELKEKGIPGQILTGTYLQFNNPQAFSRLLQYDNIEVRAFTGAFHPKGYFFYKGDVCSLIIGSSNLTATALTTNEEWNLAVSSLDSGALVKESENEFNRLWNDPKTSVVDKAWVDAYAEEFAEASRQEVVALYKPVNVSVAPNAMQKAALLGLSDLRAQGSDRGLLISATGTGKTYLSAFDIRDAAPARVLFVVHRQEIMHRAMESYKVVLGDRYTYGAYTGGDKSGANASCMFATIQTLGKAKSLEVFSPEAFDYIVVDEAHHAGAAFYQGLFDYFKPKFWLGMTATPERSDDYDIYKLFKYRIAYEIRLQDALEESLLCPFHYFGVSEVDVNGQAVDENASFEILSDVSRVEYIVSTVKKYGYSGPRVKGLCFCSRINEAQMLAKEFARRGFRTQALSGADSSEVRERAISRLEQEDGPSALDYIFTVDIFNEGVDIPSVNQIVMIRPTQSAIIFVQQLGRGLRLHQEKEYVVVIDFIGNYSNNFFIPVALYGDRSYNKDNVRMKLEEGNRFLPGQSTVSLDRVSKERIYAALDNARFGRISQLKEEYFRLKQMLGKRPALADYNKLNAIDPLMFLESSSFDSYYGFLVKYDEYPSVLNDTQREMLNFVSQKLASGKRPTELMALEHIISGGGRNTDIPVDLTGSAAKRLLGEFNLPTQRDSFAHSVFIEKSETGWVGSAEFLEALESEEFTSFMEEIVDFGLDRYERNYTEKYKDTELCLYKKYTYEDVCTLLNWDINLVALNIGGYKYDVPTNTFPVFINYDKDEDVVDTQQYEDCFESPRELKAYSKSGTSFSSPVYSLLRGWPENGLKIFLFVRKNKKDSNTSKEFYFLGEMGPERKIELDEMPTKKGSVPVLVFHYGLETPVRSDIYDYITA